MAASAQWGFLTPEPVLYHMRAPGFELFGPGHLLSLTLSLALIAITLTCYLRQPTHSSQGSITRHRILVTAAAIPVAIVAAKCATYLALGMFEPLFWPLHICNLSEFIALGCALAPAGRLRTRLGDLLFCWGSIGCLGALIFPGWSWYCPALTLASLCGFVEHALVLACLLCLPVEGDYQPEPRRVWFVLAVTVTCAAIARAANPLLGTNFFFVTNPAGAGGPFPWLVATFGDPGFLPAYLLCALALWGLAYVVFRLVTHAAHLAHARCTHACR